MFQKHRTEPENLRPVRDSATGLAGRVQADVPFVFSQRALRVLRVLLRTLRVEGENVLLVGSSGCGKTVLLGVLAWLLVQRVEELSIIPDTEPAALIGQYAPNEGAGETGERIAWTDGTVTRAFIGGHWAVLNNLSLAEATTLERLNPILETPATLVLSEKGGDEVDSLKLIPGYRLLATMTPPIAKGEASQGSELSPALCNRFTIIYMSAWAQAAQPATPEAVTADSAQAELQQLVRVLLPGEDEGAAALRLCQALLAEWPRGPRSAAGGFDLRLCVRLLQCAFLLKESRPELRSVEDALYAAFLTAIEGRIHSDHVVETRRVVLQALKRRVEDLVPLNYTAELDNEDRAEVRSHQRCHHRSEPVPLLIAHLCVRCGCVVHRLSTCSQTVAGVTRCR